MTYSINQPNSVNQRTNASQSCRVDRVPKSGLADEEQGHGCSASGACGNGLEEIYPTTAVRYGLMRHIGEFRYNKGMLFTCGGKVVVQSPRGIEVGEQVSLTCGGCSSSVPRSQILDYVRDSGAEYLRLNCGSILREATSDDLMEERRIRSEAKEKMRLCTELAQRHDLSIKVVDCEHLLGGERIIFYFMAEGRVDFRALVRDLAHEFQTRIEMRQIGARDEARLVADYETCGRECCCKNFLKKLKPVTMKMAKLQKATLDPSKVSGRCGRLKCCLRYEHETYEELDAKLPRFGQRIATAHGNGVVLARQILTQLVQIQTDDEQLMTVAIEDVLPGRPPDKTSGPTERSERGGRARSPSGPRRGDGPSSPTERSGEDSADRESATPGRGAGPRGRRRLRQPGAGGPPPRGDAGVERPPSPPEDENPSGAEDDPEIQA